MIVYWCTKHNKCHTVPHSMPLSQVCSVYITFRCIYLYGWNLKNIISLTVRFPSIKLSAISRCKQFTWTCDTFDFTYTEQKLPSCSFLWRHQQSYASQKFFQSCRQRNSKHCKIGHAQSRVKIYLKVKSKYCIIRTVALIHDTFDIWEKFVNWIARRPSHMRQLTCTGKNSSSNLFP